MTKKLLLATITLLSTGFLHAEHSKADITLEHNKHEQSVHWGYDGKGAPQHWGDIDPRYATCKNGVNQSPINLSGFTESDLPAIKFNYNLVSSEILNNGHAIQTNVKNGSTMTVDSINFELKQFHFHNPSENNINGKSFPLEAHFVHASKNGELAVIAVMFKEGEENKALAELWANMPQNVGDKNPIDTKELNALLPKDRDYYRFNGSLTTPPCTEGVRWLVMKKPITLSEAQIETFKKVMHHHNNRPIQATNSRVILK